MKRYLRRLAARLSVPLALAALPVLALAQDPGYVPPPPGAAPPPLPMTGAPPAPGPDTGAPPPVGSPGYYGQIDLVNNGQPPVVYATPLVAQPAPPGVVYPTVYLRVPPLYYQNWPMYCGYYNACFYPVFFVQESWYMRWYSPWYMRYYPYGRPGFVAHVYYQPHWGGGPHGAPHAAPHGGGWHHEDGHR